MRAEAPPHIGDIGRLTLGRLGHQERKRSELTLVEAGEDRHFGLLPARKRLGKLPREHRAVDNRFGLPSGRETRLEKRRSEEHTSELQSLMRISYAVFCLKKKTEHKISEIQIVLNRP